MSRPEKIYEFYLTEHFMKRSWDRTIDKTILTKVLKYVSDDSLKKLIVIVTPGFLKTKKVEAKNGMALIIIIHENVVITGYWKSDANKIFKNNSEVNFQLLYC